MRPTLKDLAKASGVSLATIDRVLNERIGVRTDTIVKVNETIKQIGYQRNMQAANLARQKVYNFEFLLPCTGDLFLKELVAKIEDMNSTFAVEMTSAHAKQVPVEDPHSVANYLTSLNSDDIDGIAIMLPESPPVRDAISRLSERGIRVVQFLSGQPKVSEMDFVGIDNHAAGATAGNILGRFLGYSSGKILVISETMQSRDSIERRLGFDEIITQEFKHLEVLPSVETYGNATRTERVIKNSVQNNPDLCGVYIMNSEAELPVRAIEDMMDPNNLVMVAHERTSFTEAALKCDKLDAIIDQHTGHAVRSAIRIMRARCEQREPFASQETIRIEILLKQNL